jgi:hypothetical protein
MALRASHQGMTHMNKGRGFEPRPTSDLVSPMARAGACSRYCLGGTRVASQDTNWTVPARLAQML